MKAGELYNQPDLIPTAKMQSAAIGGAVATLLIALWQILKPGVPVPPGVEGALATIAAFLAGYLTQEHWVPPELIERRRRERNEQ